MIRVKRGESMPRHEVIPSPSFGLNYVLNGGFWTGRYHLMWGSPHAGKSTFLYHVLANAQEMGYVPVIVDTEKSYTEEWAKNCGLDIHNMEIIQSVNLEEFLPPVLELMRQEKCAVLIDSLNAFESQSFFDKDEGSNQIGRGAVARRKLFMRLSEQLHPERNVVFAVCQQTVNIGAQHTSLVPKIGKAEEHWATNIVRLFGSTAKDNVMREKETERIVDKKIIWTVGKCKQAAVEGATGSYWLNPQKGQIALHKEAIDLGVRNGFIHKGGAWFTWQGEKFQGIKSLADNFDENDLETLLAMLNASGDLIMDGEIEVDDFDE